MQGVIDLIREARRRKVFRTGALYVVGAWLVLQVADVLFPAYGIPEAAKQALLWAAVLGLPVALVFGWLFEIGPGGIQRTLPASAEAVAEAQPLGRRDYLLLAAFAAIALVLVFQAVRKVRDTPQELAAPASESAARNSDRLPNSIAVLPFANISNDPDNEYFCDGISEEILNALAVIRGLNVIGRTSSFAFKGTDAGIDRISAVLGVRHVLQGSVRKAGRQLRISAQLLDESGRQVWTQTFDRELANVFEIQSEIAQAVATTVASHVTVRVDARRAPILEAYEHYLAGREHLHRRYSDHALEELQRAIDIDPQFAEAHAEWAIARMMGRPSQEKNDAGREAIDRALQLQPKLLRAQAALGLWMLQSEPADPAGAERVLRAVLEQDPNMSDALNWLANSLSVQGRDDEQVAVLQRAAVVDPLHPAIAGNLADMLRAQGNVAGAIRVLERLNDQPQPAEPYYYALTEAYRASGRLIDMNAGAKGLALRSAVSPYKSYYALAKNYGLLANWTAASYWLQRSARDIPGFHRNHTLGSLVPSWRGEANEALRQFRAGLEAHSIDITTQNPFERRWYGALLARAGRHAEAIAVLEPLVNADEDGLLSFVPTPQLDAAQALAWAYLRSGADAKAEALLTALRRHCIENPERGLAYDSDRLHQCAQIALFQGRHDVALDWLERAIATGWREYYFRENDPYWADLKADPRYRAVMAKVKADVDRQAVEIARIDAEDGYRAKLDAVVAARKETAD